MAEACRGLSMLLSFVALITAMVILVRRPLWERVVLILSIIPIALLSNIIRIAVTAVAYGYYDRPVKEVARLRRATDDGPGPGARAGSS